MFPVIGSFVVDWGRSDPNIEGVNINRFLDGVGLVIGLQVGGTTSELGST